MTRIDFYILPDEQEAARLHFACRLIDKAVQRGHQVFVAARDQAQAEQVDTLLWTFRPESFVAHQLRHTAADQCNVLIGWQEDCDDHHDMLINLSDQVPAFFSRFERLAEVVCQQPAVLEHTRQHWGFYRDRGYPIQSNKIAQGQLGSTHGQG